MDVRTLKYFLCYLSFVLKSYDGAITIFCYLFIVLWTGETDVHSRDVFSFESYADWIMRTADGHESILAVSQ